MLQTLDPVRAATVLMRARALAFDPEQPRDEHGQWTSQGASSIVPGSILEAVQKADGGFTYSPATGSSPTAGYALSLHPEREQILDAKDTDVVALATYATKNWDLLSERGNYFGAWHNPQDDKVYLDISTVVDTPEEADRLGRSANQLAYFDLKEGRSVEIASERRHGLKAATTYHWPGSWASVAGRYYRARSAIDGARTNSGRDRKSQSHSFLPISIATIRTAGGPGSGNFGHAGRPGQIGGSAATDVESADEQRVFEAIDKAGWTDDRIKGLTSRIEGYSPQETRDGVRERIRMWSETTSATPEARRMQQAVAEEFDLTRAAMNHFRGDVPSPNDFDRQFVRAEYEATQEWFQNLGVSHITVYRGMLSGLPPGQADSIAVTMQPASSWSLVRSDAYKFAAAAREEGGVIATRVPVSRVLSTAATGRGAASEGEVILLGGVFNVKLRPDRKAA